MYVAWSDGLLSREELRRIREAVGRHGALDEEARAALGAWLDPSSPPSASSLVALRARIEQLDPAHVRDPARSLASLGIELARGDRVREAPPDDGAATAEIEALAPDLGVVGREALREARASGPAGRLAPETAPLPAPPLPTDDPLRAYLDQPHAELRREILTLLREPGFRFPHELDATTYRTRVMEAIRVLADRGLGRLSYPTSVGGESDPGRALAAFETLAFGDPSVLVKFGVQFGLFGGSILQLGTKRHHDRYLQAVGSLELPGCFAMTETGHGSNVRDIETEARFDPEEGGFVIHTPNRGARKDYIGGAARDARLATVFAQLVVDDDAHGVHAFLVPIRDESGNALEGVSIEDCGLKIGLNGVDNGRIGLDHVHVPREALLDRFGTVTEQGRYRSPIVGGGRRFFTMLATLVSGRVSIAAASVSAAKSGLTIAVRYAGRRHQFGPAGEAEVPLLHYLAHQRLLLPRLARTYALHFAVRRLTDDYVRSSAPDGDPGASREVEARAAVLKALASEDCARTLQACREACGGQGYLAENRIGRLRADTDVFTTFEGANAVLLQLVAKALLSEYREEMADMRLRDVVRLLASSAQTRLTELNPMITRRTDPEHLRDPEFQASAFRYREARLVRSAALRLKSLIDDGVDTFEAMNTCQDHLITLARAHGDRLAVEAFQEAAKGAATAEIATLLGPLSDLHALSRLEEGRAWYLESRYFEPPKSRAIRAVVNDLCGELAPSVNRLVDAFGIPGELLEAPIAL